MHALLCAFILMSLTAESPTTSWPRFRGPNGSGHGAGFLWPKQWDESVIRWKVELPGEGHGSPVIHEGRLYLQCASRSGSERIILCLNSRDGSELWRSAIPGQRAAMHKKNSLASGSAATDGHTVCFCHWDGSSVSLSGYACQDGKRLWTVPLGAYESQHGPGHSPILHDGKAIVNFDSDTLAEVCCVDVRMGKKLWAQPRAVHRANYSTPLVREGRDGAEVIIASSAGITGYHLDTGKILWDWSWPFAQKPLRSVSSPILAPGDLLLAASGDGGGDRDTVAVKLPATVSTSAKLKLQWQLRRDVPYVTTLLANGNHVFYVADKGVAGCLSLQTGRDLWQQRLSGNFTASPLLIDDRIVTVNEAGELMILAADSQHCRIVGKLALHDQILATPGLADGCLYIRGQKTLYCLGAMR